MKQHLGSLGESRVLWADVHLFSFDAPELANALRPGQFALVRDPHTFDPYLRRVVWLYARENSRVSFAIPASDPLVARARAGDVLDVLAPLGRALEFPANVRRIVLLGDDTRIARLVAIAHDALARGCEIVMVHQSAQTFPAYLLSPEIEFRTDADALEQVMAWADAVVMTGSDALRQSLVDTIRAVRYRTHPGFARVLVDVTMPCGAGVCYACAQETAHGLKRACVDGPVFDLSEFEKRMTR